MRIDELTLLALDIDAQAAFYGDVLGLQILHGADVLYVVAGATRLVFRSAPSPLPGPYHFAFNVPADALPAAKAWLRERGVPPVPGPDGADEFDFDFWDARATYFRDPAGNLLEFIARDEVGGSLARADFGPDAILNVSEIGIATDDVPALVASHTKHHPGLSPYRQEVNDSFVALGDAHGLFIVVRTGRVWFPTADLAACPLPLLGIVRVAESSPPQAVGFGPAPQEKP